MKRIDKTCFSRWFRAFARTALPTIAIATAGIAFGSPPQAFVSGQTLSAGDLNAHFSYANDRVHDPSGFRATLSTQTNVSGGFVPILFDQVSFDLADEYDPQSGTFTPKEEGIYSLECGLFFLSPPSQLYTVAIVGPASLEYAGSAVPGANPGVTVTTSTIVKLPANMPVQCGAYDSGGTTAVELGQADRVYFSVMRLN